MPGMRRREFITLLGGAAACLAARSARAAVGEAADHRVPRALASASAGGPMDRRFRAAAARTRLDRGPDRRDRVSLGGGTASSATPRSPPSSSGSRSMSSSRSEAQFPHSSRRHRSFPSSSQSTRTRLAGAWSRHSRDRAAMSPACRSNQPSLLASELELLREVLPGFRRLAVLANVGFPGAVQEMGEVQAAARTLGLEVVPSLEIRRAEDIALRKSSC